ncbi:glycosyltransferase family 9 protein [Maribrevibacterium harenarium]|uniref:Glycosyltransferase family 9 protein n=1 Tax=Maribrevibacterium harenarium TaxID=2589817 RepID=A0A501X2F0_9GAMM|nr:glycosyltransferase family 9 protein [Maribrevibacterium harenarium]TPE54662.1 glycosyltransferase family 9 protein [Maribrevibacterium harenarium]
MSIVLLRSRPFFGAQMTCIPATYAASLISGKCKVYTKHKVGYIYEQLPWVEETVEKTSFLTELKGLDFHSHILNLRPTKRLEAKLLAFLTSSELMSVPKDVDTSIYRALWHVLPIAETVNISPLDLLKLPYIELARLSNLDFQNDTFNVSILPGAGGGDFKKWGVINFINFCKRLENTLNKKFFQFHWILGPDEKKEMDEIIKALHPNFIIHSNKNLSDISAIINKSDLVISNDCGPSHIAQCLQKNMVIIYDKKKPEWFLSRKNAVAIYPKNNESIQEISVENVILSAISILEDN